MTEFKFILEGSSACLFIEFILNLVIFESFICCRLQVVCEGLERRLQVVSVGDFVSVLLI